MADPKDVKPATPTAAPATPKVLTSEEAMTRAISEGIALGIAAANRMHAAPAQTAVPKTTCGVCGQYVSGCNNEHRLLAVYPQNPKHGKFFQGIRINGVRYLSNSRAHKIWVPKDCNIEHLFEHWEHNEDDQAQGKEVEHNSGTLSGRGSSNFIPAGSDGSSFR